MHLPVGDRWTSAQESGLRLVGSLPMEGRFVRHGVALCCHSGGNGVPGQPDGHSGVPHQRGEGQAAEDAVEQVYDRGLGLCPTDMS